MRMFPSNTPLAQMLLGASHIVFVVPELKSGAVLLLDCMWLLHELNRMLVWILIAPLGAGQSLKASFGGTKGLRQDAEHSNQSRCHRSRSSRAIPPVRSLSHWQAQARTAEREPPTTLDADCN